MNTPVVLNKACQVSAVRIGNQKRFGRLAASQCDREEQIVVIDPAIAVTVEVRKILDHFDATRLEYSQIKIGVNALNFSANAQGVVALDRCERVAELEATLFGTLRYAERRAVLNAGKGKLRPGIDGLNVVIEGAETKVETVNVAGIQDARVVRQKRMRVVDACLTLRSRADRSIQCARRYVVFALQGIAKEQVIGVAGLPVETFGAQ